MAITRINEFHAAEGKSDELKKFLRGLIEQIKDAPGCKQCRLLVDPTDKSRLAIIEKWDNVDSHQAAAGRVPPEQYKEFQPLIAEQPSGRYYKRVKNK